MLFLTAFLTGVFGSFHCVGMCGPIAFALPGKGQLGFSYFFGRILYNFGRISTYAFLGLISGFFGLGLKLAGMQQGISIGIGLLILIWVVAHKVIPNNFSFNPLKFLGSNLFTQLFKSGTKRSLFLLGMVNGFLPCGFVYIALLGATVTQNIAQGALFMFFFGLGTFPMMFGASIIGQFLSQPIRSKINRLSPIFAIFIACLFILRGLNLGIPYLSPQIYHPQNAIENCH